MDNSKSTNRNKYMTNRIPNDRNTLIYVGVAHLLSVSQALNKPTSIPEWLEVKGVKAYRVYQISSKKTAGTMEHRVHSMVRHSQYFAGKKGFGLDVKGDNLYWLIDEYGKDWFDGILYHT